MIITKRRAARLDTQLRAVGDERAPSHVGVRIASASHVHGWLSLRDTVAAEDATEADELMAVSVGGQAGVACENARLYAELTRQVSALEHEVAERTRTTDRIDVALAAAHMGIGEMEIATGRVIWSDSTAALFGITLESFGGTFEAFYELVHPEDRAALRQEYATALADGRRDLVTEFRTIWPDGSTHWVQNRAHITDDSAGRPFRILSVGFDVTDRRLLEEQLRQAQKMEAIGQLAGGVAHDFNNMLTVILGYSELLTEQIGPDKPIGQDLDAIRAAAQRAAALTQQLLAFSRKQVLTVTPVDLTQIVGNLEPMLRRLLGEPITIRTVLADGLDLVLADAAQLEHLLINLSVNARDAMPDGGVLTIATRNIELDAGYVAVHPGAKTGSYAVLSVTDTGLGMLPDVQGKIFEPFFTTKESGRGTGLGLAAVYGTVKQLGGYIGVDSQSGRGTTFAIHLPKTHHPATLPSASIGSSPVGRETILLVEDERSVRTFTKTALQRFGYQVLEAESAEAALTLLSDVDALPIHLLLTDVILGGMDGRELAVRVTGNRPQVRVLFMSGYASRLGTLDGLIDRDVQLLEKPFTAKALLTKARHVLAMKADEPEPWEPIAQHKCPPHPRRDSRIPASSTVEPAVHLAERGSPRDQQQ